MENLGVLVRKGASHLCRARPKRRFLFYQYPRELYHLARFFRRWRLREACGVRGACSRFRVSNHQRKRQQAGRTPYASRGSVAALPAVPRCAVSPISRGVSPPRTSSDTGQDPVNSPAGRLRHAKRRRSFGPRERDGSNASSPTRSRRWRQQIKLRGVSGRHRVRRGSARHISPGDGLVKAAGGLQL